MPITEEQKQEAQSKQNKVAYDKSPQVRLLAGPGTGKSFVIEKRVEWLLSNGVPPSSIYVVSFTRAASQDLKKRIIKNCKKNGFLDAEFVNVSTLHSLALKVLRLGNRLIAEPMVLDNWEVENIFDAEMSIAIGYSPSKCKDLREIYEASLATNVDYLAGHRLPDLPTEEEEAKFKSFHQSRKGVYRFVLSGEIIKKCVDECKVGTVDPPKILKASHLIVDEYQDLNETDQEFIKSFIEGGVTTFVCGDDDQSLYSFRFASPTGLQTFTSDYPLSGNYELSDCFRCTVDILSTAKQLIIDYGGTQRIYKSTHSLHEQASPPNKGKVLRWQFSSGRNEAKIIAQSCKELIKKSNGVIKPSDILILISNQNRLLSKLKTAFEEEEIAYELPTEEGFIDTQAGRFLYGLLRIVCNENDYVAHRVMFGQLSGVGTSTTNNLVEGVIANPKTNYKDIFHSFFKPQGRKYDTRALNLLEKARDICVLIKDWSAEDTLEERTQEIFSIIMEYFGESEQFMKVVNPLPTKMTLEELKSFIAVDNFRQQETLIKGVYDRLEIEIPDDGLLPSRVRMMTIHSSKGLDSSVVFIPGLEEGTLPREKQKDYQADVSEAARMLYVAITRSKAACVLSYSNNRYFNGDFHNMSASRFVSSLGGFFNYRDQQIDEAEITEIINSIESFGQSNQGKYQTETTNLINAQLGLDVFLSYSRKDTSIMKRVEKTFIKRGLNTWTDEGIELGTPSWRKKIEEKIENTKSVVCIATPDSKLSYWVQEELGYAMMQGKSIYLILAKGHKANSIPFGFSEKQWSDIRNPTEYDKEINKLVITLKSKA